MDLTTFKENAKVELQRVMDEWCNTHSNNFSGGKMRSDRGDGIETYVRNLINNLGNILNIDLVAKRGSDDKKDLVINLSEKQITKKHQVDIHVYLNGNFIAVIECKAYLDSCYYVRACEDFKLFKKFGYNVRNMVFTLENSIDEDTKLFTDHTTDNICGNVFYILDGKRVSTKPIYDAKFKKLINTNNLYEFIDFVYNLQNTSA